MSRHIHQIEEGSVAYGLDHTCGYWLEVFNEGGDMVHRLQSDPFFPDEVRTHRADIANYLGNVGVSEDVTDRIMMDMEI